jgi:hypothetical protein
MPAQPAPTPAAPAPSPHNGQVQSVFKAAQITPATYRPNADRQVTKTVGWNPDPPAVREASSQAAGTVTYSGDSPTGYQPSTDGQDWDQQVMGSF